MAGNSSCAGRRHTRGGDHGSRDWHPDCLDLLALTRLRLQSAAQPPICDIDFDGLMKPGLLIRCPSSLRQIAVSSTEPRWSSDTPERISSRSGVSCSENRHVRRPPSAVRRMRLHVVQKAWLTEEMNPTPPGAPSANV